MTVQRAVLLSIETEVYTDGRFITNKEWAKLQINIVRLKEESDLLRVELDKF